MSARAQDPELADVASPQAIRFVVGILACSLAATLASARLRLSGPTFLLFGSVYMLTPGALALLLVRGTFRERLRALAVFRRIGPWFATAWLAPAVFAALTVVASMAMPDVRLTPNLLERVAPDLSFGDLLRVRAIVDRVGLSPGVLLLAQALIAGPTVNAALALGEELGWRGFLHRELRPNGFWHASLATGVVWGLWHVPLIRLGLNYPSHPRLGVLLMVGLTCLLSPLFAVVRDHSGSTLAAAVMHGSFNAMAGLSILAVAGGNELTIGLTGLAGAAVLLMANVALFATRLESGTPRRVSRRPIPSVPSGGTE